MPRLTQPLAPESRFHSLSTGFNKRECAQKLLEKPAMPPGLLLFLQHVGLALRLHSTMPVDPLEAVMHVEAAIAASTDEISPEVLLSIAYIESRYEPMALSRIEGKHRVLGVYLGSQPPKRWKKGTSLHCGPLQTYALTWDECVRQRDLGVAYASASKQLSTWLRDRRVRGDLTRALAGYGCGNHGVKTGKCNRYPGRVLWQARRIASNRPVPGPV